MVFRQHVLSITTLTINYNFSVLIFLDSNLIPIVKDTGYSDRLPEMIKIVVQRLGMR